MALHCPGITLGGVLACLSACGPAQAPLTDADRRALTDSVVAGMNSYLAAVKSLDSGQVAPFYVRGSDFRFYYNGQAYSRDAVLSLIAGLRRGLRSLDATWDTISVTPLGHDAALAAAFFRRTLIDTAGVTSRDHGTVTWVWVRRDGAWHIIHGQAVHYPTP